MGEIKIRNKWLKTIGILLGLLIFGYLVYEVYLSLLKIDAKAFFLQVRYGLLLLSVLMLSFFIFCTASLWTLIVKKLDGEVKYRDCMAAYNLSLLAKYLPGGIWNLVGRVVFLQKKGVSLVVTSSSIIYEFLFLIASSTTVGGVLLFKYDVFPTWAIIGIYACMLFFLLWPNAVIVLMNKMLVLFKRNPITLHLSRRHVLAIYLLFVLVWSVYGAAFLVFIKAMNLGFSQSFLQLVAILASSWLAGYLSPTPGGIGVREGLMVFLLGKTSVASFASLISVISRVWFICAEILLIAIFFVLAGIRKLSRKEVAP